MRPLGINMSNVKQVNRSHVLWLLLTEGAMSRTDLASRLRLTTATLTSICGDFISRGIIIEEGKEASSSLGRKKSLLSINQTYKYVISVNIHYTGSTIAITNLMGEPLALEHFAIDPALDVPGAFQDIANRIVLLLWKTKLKNKDILGIGVDILGPVNHNEGIALHPFHVFHGQEVPIQKILEELLPFPVCVESNVCSFLNAENLYGTAKYTANTMVVKWGPGVGSATSINGALYKGANYQSSEIGHTYFYRGSTTVCRCGKTGCLETGVHLNQITEKILSLQESSPVIRGALLEYGQPTIHNIRKYLALDCLELRSYLTTLIYDLSIGINNAISVFAPNKVILFGEIFECPFVMETFIQQVSKINPFLSTDIFEQSSLAPRKEFIGGAATAVQSFLLEPGGA